MRLVFLLSLTLFSASIYSQKIRAKTVCRLPEILWESSGLIAGTDSCVWTHNDSGGKAMLYKLNTEGKVIRRLYISKVKNTDWEDLANDYLGNVYIADIGNNRNNRKNLRILKIPHPDSLKTDTVAPQIINFVYENQTQFPPSESQLNFDAEALIAYQDSLFLFTKNRTKPYSKYTYVYAIANQEGEQLAVLKDSIYLSHTHRLHSWVTGATRHPNRDLVVLISHKKAWLINGFRTAQRKTLIDTKISGMYSQKEAVCFDIDQNLWISNERYYFLKSKLKESSFKNRLNP